MSKKLKPTVKSGIVRSADLLLESTVKDHEPRTNERSRVTNTILSICVLTKWIRWSSNAAATLELGMRESGDTLRVHEFNHSVSRLVS